MARYYAEIQERRREDLAQAKAVLKDLHPAGRAHLLAWLCCYFDDLGERTETERRRQIVLDGTEYWLVKMPKRQNGHGTTRR